MPTAALSRTAARRWMFSLAALSLLAALPAAADESDRVAALLAGESQVRVINRIQGGVIFGTFDPQGRMTGELRVASYAAPYEYPRVTTPSFYITIENRTPFPDVVERLVHLANIVVSRDDGHLGLVRQPIERSALPWVLAWEALAIAIAALIAGLIRRGKVIVELKLPHLLPALLQTTIFLYWSIYWPGVPRLIESVLIQLLLAYTWDAFINLALFKQWKIGFGPIPITFSANLFAWLNPPAASLLIFVAIASRALIRRQGRHILNPSAAGLSVALLLTYAFPDTFVQAGPFTLLTLAPNMAELILVLALIPQLRFRIVLASIGAYTGVLIIGKFYPYMPGLMQPGMLLMLTLFLTDPATMPKSLPGQFLFGMSVGINIGVVTWAGHALGAADERLNKVLPVAIANMLTPWFEKLGERIAAFKWRILEPKWNLAYVALWIVLIYPEVGSNKRYVFSATRHWSYGTPIVNRDADDVPRCENNPIFCQPFTFGQEAAAWFRRLSRG